MPGVSKRTDTRLARSPVASLALAEFREWPVHPVRRIMGWLIRGRVREWSDPDATGEVPYREALARSDEPKLADAAISTQAAALGLRYVGVAEERSLFNRIRKDVWLDAERTLQLHSRHRLLADHAPRSVYHFSTYFQDGSCMLTWSHPPQTPSDDRLASRAGSGELARDLEDHRAAVAGWAEQRGTQPLVVDGPDAVAGLLDHYYRYVVPKSMAVSYLIGLLLLLLIASWVVAFFWRILG
jgi:hypothetical protein